MPETHDSGSDEGPAAKITTPASGRSLAGSERGGRRKHRDTQPDRENCAIAPYSHVPAVKSVAAQCLARLLRSTGAG